MPPAVQAYFANMPDEVRAYFQAITSEGGKARAKKLSKQRRLEIAKKAARARWAKTRRAST